MRKPRNCNGCKAHYQCLWKHTCELGYEMSSRKIGTFQGVEISEYYPKLGQCPKPRTLKELINAPKAWEGYMK